MFHFLTYVKPVKYLCHNLQNDLFNLFKRAQTMCPENVDVISIRKVFQIPLRYKSNTGKKIIPIFLKGERINLSRRSVKVSSINPFAQFTF
jgi:hypothetical protein